MSLGVDQIVVTSQQNSVQVSEVNNKVYVQTPGALYPNGGSAGQVLAKASGARNDVLWLTLGGMASQNADNVAITGGAMDGVEIGLQQPQDARFLDILYRTADFSSDATGKEDIEPLPDMTEKLMQLKPVSYYRKTEDQQADRPLELGFIAQQVREVFPDMVGDRYGSLTLRGFDLVAVLVKVVQEQQRKLEELERRCS